MNTTRKAYSTHAPVHTLLARMGSDTRAKLTVILNAMKLGDVEQARIQQGHEDQVPVYIVSSNEATKGLMIILEQDVTEPWATVSVSVADAKNDNFETPFKI